jgi:hypothetical protein
VCDGAYLVTKAPLITSYYSRVKKGEKLFQLCLEFVGEGGRGEGEGKEGRGEGMGEGGRGGGECVIAGTKFSRQIIAVLKPNS